MRLKANLAADAAILLTTMIWGSTFVTAKDILDYWPPLAYLALRLALAAALMAALFGKQLRAARREEWRAGAVLGLLIGAGLTGQAFGQFYTTAAKSAFIAGLTTPLVPFIAYGLVRARPSRENLAGVVLASVGGALILAPSGSGAGGANVGDLISLLCTLLFAAHISLMSAYGRRCEPRRLAAVQILVAAALLATVWALVRASGAFADLGQLPRAVAREFEPLVWSARVLGQLVYLSVVGTVAAFALWSWGQARMSATHAAIIFSLEPVFATLFAVAARGPGEWPGGRANLGAALVLAGVIVSELRWGGGEQKAEGRRQKAVKNKRAEDRSPSG